MRSLLLAMSGSAWLRDRATKAAFVRRATRRFMPGETFDDMLAAAREQSAAGLRCVFTRLGENVTRTDEAESVTRHYLDALDRVVAERLECEPSVKLTQLGLDVDEERCFEALCTIAARADARGFYLWVDMEQSPYVDRTLSMVRNVRVAFPNVGVCLQSYLHRTPADLPALLESGCGVRLVKGAYREPPSVAHAAKRDVDAAYFTLARTMLSPAGRAAGARLAFGTHDLGLVARVREHARAAGAPDAACEIHMLYGIQRAAQRALAAEGANVRVLIAYGSYWFPWYMRRLAERPANVWFVARSLFS